MEVQFVVGDLTRQEVEAIANPANSEGEMGGGVAGALKKAGGETIEQEAMEQAPIPIGKAVVTSAGKLPCAYVIHAPTMVMPAQRTSRDKIAKAMSAVFTAAREYDFKSLAIPGMGTGTGKVAPKEAAAAMVEVLRKVAAGKSVLEKVVLVDRSEEMVEAWKTAWQQPEIVEEAEPTAQPDEENDGDGE